MKRVSVILIISAVLSAVAVLAVYLMLKTRKNKDCLTDDLDEENDFIDWD